MENLKPGSIAPQFEAEDVKGVKRMPIGENNRKLLLSFFRHAGCPPCNLRLRELILAKAELDKKNIDVLCVFESSPENIVKHLEHDNVPYPILADRNRKLYAKYSVSPSMVGFIKSMTIKPMSSMKAVFGQGYTPRLKENTTMMPAEFLIDSNGIIKMAYYGTDIGDFPKLQTIYQAAQGR